MIILVNSENGVGRVEKHSLVFCEFSEPTPFSVKLYRSEKSKSLTMTSDSLVLFLEEKISSFETFGSKE